MIVDDDPVFLKATATKLQSAGFHVRTAQEGVEAVAALGEQPAEAVLMDIDLSPGVFGDLTGSWDGFQLMSWMRGLPTAREARFIMVSNSDSVSHRQRAEQLGAVAYFRKPLDYDRLFARLAGLDQRTGEPGATLRTVIYNGKIGIRQFCLEDAPAHYAAVRESIRELSAWMAWCHAGYSLTEARAFVSDCAAAWHRDERYSFVIFDRKDGAFLGSVGLSCVNRAHRFANLGYWVRTSRAAQGAASAATLLAARFGLEELGLQRLELVVPVDNVASQRVAEKVGAKQEGILRNRIILRGKSHDAVLYSLVAEDLAEPPAAQPGAAEGLGQSGGQGQYDQDGADPRRAGCLPATSFTPFN